MKSGKSLSILTALVLSNSANAALVTIDFDDIIAPSTFASQTALTEEYASLGVHFTGTGEVINSGGNFTGVPLTLPFSSPNFLAFNNEVGSFPPETITFDYLLDSFSMDFAGSSGMIYLSGYMGSTLVNTVSMSTTYDAWSSLTLTGGIYDKVVFNVLNTDPHFVVDNLTINAVPVPAAVWLFFSGLTGLAVFAKRKKS